MKHTVSNLLSVFGVCICSIFANCGNGPLFPMGKYNIHLTYLDDYINPKGSTEDVVWKFTYDNGTYMWVMGDQKVPGKEIDGAVLFYLYTFEKNTGCEFGNDLLLSVQPYDRISIEGSGVVHVEIGASKNGECQYIVLTTKIHFTGVRQ